MISLNGVDLFDLTAKVKAVDETSLTLDFYEPEGAGPTFTFRFEFIEKNGIILMQANCTKGTPEEWLALWGGDLHERSRRPDRITLTHYADVILAAEPILRPLLEQAKEGNFPNLGPMARPVPVARGL